MSNAPWSFGGSPSGNLDADGPRTNPTNPLSSLPVIEPLGSSDLSYKYYQKNIKTTNIKSKLFNNITKKLADGSQSLGIGSLILMAHQPPGSSDPFLENITQQIFAVQGCGVLHVSWSVYETRLCDFIRPDYISPLRRVHSTKQGFTGNISQSLRCLLR